MRCLLLLFQSLSPAFAGPPVDVCLRNDSPLSPQTIAHFESGLKAHEKEWDVLIRFTCEADSVMPVNITIRRAPAPTQFPDALGATRVRDGRVVGDLEVFLEPVLQMVSSIRSLSPALEGWALARVAAHELFHFLQSEIGHKPGGLNQEFLTPRGLVRGFRPKRLSRS